MDIQSRAEAYLRHLYPDLDVTLLGKGHRAVVFKLSIPHRNDAESIVARVVKPEFAIPEQIKGLYSILSRHQVPIVRIVKAPDDREKGILIEFWEYVTPLHETDVTLAATAIERLHASSRGISIVETLPKWSWIKRTRESLKEVEQLGYEKTPQLVTAFNEVNAVFQNQGVGGMGLLHGDAHPVNIGFDKNRELRFIDLDDLSYGPLAWDWSAVLMFARRFRNNDADPRQLFKQALNDTGASKDAINAMVTLKEISLICYGVLNFQDNPEALKNMAHRIDTLNNRKAAWESLSDL